MDRRKFISGVALTSAALVVQSKGQQSDPSKASKTLTEAAAPKQPVLIASANGFNGADGGYTLLTRGRDTLDAVGFVLKVQEDDPADDSVGYGGLPNEDGEVELDACVMHGPTRRAGAVAGVRNIKNVAAVARLVMERTNHLLLVGEGAQKFAMAHGFPKENLLTEASRKKWMLWKEFHSNADGWGPGISDPKWKPPVAVPAQKSELFDQQRFNKQVEELYQLAEQVGIAPEHRLAAVKRVMFPPTGTIHCSAVNEKGEISGGTTTSGLAWKLAGRVGDSPIIGAGCFTDPDVGSAGATGTGEECIKVAGAHTIVENMRHGMSPEEAGMDALRRIARNHNNNMDKLAFLSMTFYVLRKDGAHAGVTLWGAGPKKYLVHDGTKRLEVCKALFEGKGISWPPNYEAK
ncbi:MAG TPA: N(4)-(beta-N-acetylglucosaminyl)-L-asparaginase [Terriglobales bacterium]|nr:N(4)-(beta-N-acetylglucosaminyl)-L-asparaginase [Terriglobales bacterium]